MSSSAAATALEGGKRVLVNGVESGVEAGKCQALATGTGGIPDFPGLVRLDVGDGSLL